MVRTSRATSASASRRALTRVVKARSKPGSEVESFCTSYSPPACGRGQGVGSRSPQAIAFEIGRAPTPRSPPACGRGGKKSAITPAPAGMHRPARPHRAAS
uniref:hypothetical protein n=1 Tax=Sphingomonas bacterium TaxID=1895847 RepID=UPI00345BDEB5